MSKDELIDEILKRVLKKISERENQHENMPTLPKLLVIANPECAQRNLQDYEDILGKDYEIHCSCEYQNDIELADYSSIVITDLDNGSLSKLAKGEFESSYLALIGRAIMAGKKILLPLEEIEFKRYEKTMPTLLRGLLTQKLNALKQWKVEMKPLNDIATELTKVGRRSVMPDGFDADVLHKKFITDKDVLSIIEAGAGEIRIAKTSIITDIAMERIQRNGLSLLRL